MKNPSKVSLKTEIIPILLIFISFGLSFYFYQNLPDQVVTHWNFAGEPDGYSSKTLTILLFPGLALLMYLIFLVAPGLDPQKKNYQEFSKIYHGFKSLIVAFLVLMYLYIGLAALGWPIKINQVIPLAVGLLLIFFGYLMPKIKSNWFMGIRTPWTLSNPIVWEKTHRLGGKMFMIGGVIIAVIPLIPAVNKTIAAIFLTAIIAMALVPIVYSYLVYRKEEEK